MTDFREPTVSDAVAHYFRVKGVDPDPETVLAWVQQFRGYEPINLFAAVKIAALRPGRPEAAHVHAAYKKIKSEVCGERLRFVGVFSVLDLSPEDWDLWRAEQAPRDSESEEARSMRISAWIRDRGIARRARLPETED